jgi:hypothetical protein
MEEQEKAFFEWFAQVESHLDHYTARMIWDSGYSAGKIWGLDYGLKVMKGEI